MVILLICFFASFAGVVISSPDDGEPNSTLTNVLVGCLLLSLTLVIWVAVLYRKEKQKLLNHEEKERELERQKQSLEIKREELEIQREHYEKSQYRQCAHCGSRISADSVRCPSCGG